MKNKVPNFINDYLIDIKKYYNKTKKLIKKVYRKIKYCWNNPKSNTSKKIISFFYNLIEQINLFYRKYILNNEKRKKSFLISTLFLIILLIAILAKPSFAIYQNEFDFSVLKGIVGNKYVSQFDSSLLIYKEDIISSGSGSGSYILTNDIPTVGYIYNGYKCKNNSKVTYDTETNLAFVDLEQKDICSLYFNLVSESDVTLKIMLEDSQNTDTYSLSKTIPYYGYKYSHYECNNNSILTYDSNLHKAKLEVNKKDSCSIYFKKESVDIDISLYVESTSESYIENDTIPSGNNYILNQEFSSCTNMNNERAEASISYIDGYIEVTTTEVAYCKVYLDIQDE